MVHLAVSIQLSPGIQSFLMWGTIVISFMQILCQIKLSKDLSFSRRLPDVIGRILEYIYISTKCSTCVRLKCYLCSNHKLVADAPLLCPLSDELLRALILAGRLR